MRLIDADVLMKKIREVDFVADVDLMKITHDSMLTGFFHGSVQGIVDRLPTAYDLDKVVKQLEAELSKAEERYRRYADEDDLSCIFDMSDTAEKRFETIKEMLEIVKKGGAV